MSVKGTDVKQDLNMDKKFKKGDKVIHKPSETVMEVDGYDSRGGWIKGNIKTPIIETSGVKCHFYIKTKRDGVYPESELELLADNNN